MHNVKSQIDAAALQASWKKVTALDAEPARIFYGLLFASDPSIRLMFPVGMTEQRDKLLKALGHIVSNVGDPNVMGEFGAQLGRDHRRFRVLRHHYKLVGDALLETLRRCLGLDWTTELEHEWRQAFGLIARLMIDGADRDAAVNPPAWEATIDTIERRTAGTAAIYVAVHTYPYDFLPGQSCAVEHPSRPGVWRYLTPANPCRSDGRVLFLVRAIAGGQLSPALVYQASPGDVVRLGPPVGTALTGWHRQPGPLLLIAGGTGLAPFQAIVQHLAADPTWHHPVTLVYGVDSAHELQDAVGLHALQQHLPWFSMIPAVARDRQWSGHCGTAVDVALYSGQWQERQILLCGSPAMSSASVERLTAAGYDRAAIRVETFSSAGYPPLAPLADHLEVPAT